MKLGSVEHFTKIYNDLADEQNGVNTMKKDCIPFLERKIQTLKEKIELLEQENEALKKEITLSKNLKNFMVDGFDIDNPYDYR